MQVGDRLAVDTRYLGCNDAGGGQAVCTTMRGPWRPCQLYFSNDGVGQSVLLGAQGTSGVNAENDDVNNFDWQGQPKESGNSGTLNQQSICLGGDDGPHKWDVNGDEASTHPSIEVPKKAKCIQLERPRAKRLRAIGDTSAQHFVIADARGCSIPMAECPR